MQNSSFDFLFGCHLPFLSSKKNSTIVISAWRHAFTLLGKNYFAFFSAPASLALLEKHKRIKRKMSTESALEEAKSSNGSREKRKILKIWCHSDENMISPNVLSFSFWLRFLLFLSLVLLILVIHWNKLEQQ